VLLVAHEGTRFASVAIMALACSSASVVVTKSKIAEPLREWAFDHSEWLGQLLECPYCFAHWIAAIIAAIYQPKLLNSGWGFADVFMAWLAIVALATWFSAVTVQSVRVFQADHGPQPYVTGYEHTDELMADAFGHGES